jgi:AraC-like DNA-binding protein
MKPVLYSSHGTLLLKPSLPYEWNGGVLAGSEAYSYEGPLGTATIQKFRDKKFSICYAASNFFQRIKLFWDEKPLLRLQYILDGTFRYCGNGERAIKLRSGQVNAVWAPGRETIADLEKGDFKIFQIAFSLELVQELLPQFPAVASLPNETSKQWIGEDREKDIYDILNAPYEDNAQRFFYGTKIREHLLSLLLPAPPQGLERYTDDEIERVYKVDRKILKDLSQHYTTEELAAYVKMSEGKLIAAFKEIIGASMFDRYKEAKLQKAKKYLLETDTQVKVLYEMVGYSSYTGFVEAFTERFGLSPLRYRKKFRPFD